MTKVFEPKSVYNSILYTKAFNFGVRTVKFYKYLLSRDKIYDPIYRQLLKSGTSIGANISESRSSSSKKDFINKLNIALKESRETDYWLQILKESEIINLKEFNSLISDIEEIQKLLTSSIKTAKGNL